jgi:hypothetical protein
VLTEAQLVEKLRLIEALFAGAATDGERDAADYARERILARLGVMEAEDPPLEYRFSMADMWSRRVFVALARRYGLRPYRYRRQRHTTVMLKVSKRFVDETLWPEYLKISDALEQYLSDVTDRVVAEVINADTSEAEEVSESPALVMDNAKQQTQCSQSAASPSAAGPSNGAGANGGQSAANRAGANGGHSAANRAGANNGAGSKTNAGNRNRDKRRRKRRRGRK